jgi:hypothetical protein
VPDEKDYEIIDGPAALSAVVDTVDTARSAYEIIESPSKAAIDNQLLTMADDAGEKNQHAHQDEPPGGCGEEDGEYESDEGIQKPDEASEEAGDEDAEYESDEVRQNPRHMKGQKKLAMRIGNTKVTTRKFVILRKMKRP